MILIELKKNIISLNRELETYINSKEKILYTKPTGFIFNVEECEWIMMTEGLKSIEVSPLYNHHIGLELTEVMVSLNDIFKDQQYDIELLETYARFKKNIFLAAKRLIEIDYEEEARGRHYMTYEQMINVVLFHYFHLYCIYFDIYIENFDNYEISLYRETLKQFHFIKERSVSINKLLFEANKASEIKIANMIIKILEQEDTLDKYKKILNDMKLKLLNNEKIPILALNPDKNKACAYTKN